MLHPSQNGRTKILIIHYHVFLVKHFRTADGCGYVVIKYCTLLFEMSGEKCLRKREINMTTEENCS